MTGSQEKSTYYHHWLFTDRWTEVWHQFFFSFFLEWGGGGEKQHMFADKLRLYQKNMFMVILCLKAVLFLIWYRFLCSFAVIPVSLIQSHISQIWLDFLYR